MDASLIDAICVHRLIPPQPYPCGVEASEVPQGFERFVSESLGWAKFQRLGWG